MHPRQRLLNSVHSSVYTGAIRVACQACQTKRFDQALERLRACEYAHCVLQQNTPEPDSEYAEGACGHANSRHLFLPLHVFATMGTSHLWLPIFLRMLEGS